MKGFDKSIDNNTCSLYCRLTLNLEKMVRCPGDLFEIEKYNVYRIEFTASNIHIKRFLQTSQTEMSIMVSKLQKIGSCGVALEPHCAANLYQGELQ